MARLNKLLGYNRDVPLMSEFWAASATGTNDYEHPMLVIPNLANLVVPSGATGNLPVNDLYIKSVTLTTEASVTGANTNYFAFNIRQYTAGAVKNIVNTTCASSISVGANTVSPASMAGMQANMMLYISAGTGTAEYVLVTAVSYSAGTITFTAANTHSGAYTFTTGNIATVSFVSGSNATAWTPLQSNVSKFTNVQGNSFLPGDVLTLQRQSFGTGLTSPAVLAVVEWVMLSNNQPLG